MMRQKLASVVLGSPSFALRRMNGFSPVRMRRLGSAMVMASILPLLAAEIPGFRPGGKGKDCRGILARAQWRERGNLDRLPAEKGGWMAKPLKRRLAAVLVLDVAGYSRLMQGDEEGTHARVSDLLREVVEPRIAEYHGRIVKGTGDGALVEFASVIDATRCAIAIQKAMREIEIDLPADQRVQFRIGINLGDVIVEPTEIYGDGVNIAVRLEGIAEAGGICVSEIVADQVGDRLGARFIDMGQKNLKNIARPVRVFRVALDDVGVPTRRGGTVALPGLEDRPAIAVLPFANLSGDPEQEYFADGLTEDIITALASWRSFPVIARNSMFTYKGRTIDVRTIGREVGAHYVVEGSVRRQTSHMRISAELIDVETNHCLFAERYDREVTDIFAVQDEIRNSILGALEPELVRLEMDRAARAPRLFSAYDY